MSEAECWQLAQGQRFFLGGYRLLGLIGSGGMGQVFRAYDLQLQRSVALKVLSPRSTRRAMQRFLREVRAAGALAHPHIVKTLDADADGDVQFLVMELAKGMDLRRWLNRHGPLPSAWACECALQTAEALEYAHQQGVLHRDVKPANLAADARDLYSRPSIKVLDLGLARFVDPDLTSLTGLRERVGTPDYMAPELVQGLGGAAADPRSEVFSLGATLFELLTGAPPERGETSVLHHRPQLARELAGVVARMLAHDPAKRFATAAHAAAALAPFAWDSRAAAMEGSNKPAELPKSHGLDDAHVLDELEPSPSLLASVSRILRRGVSQLASASMALTSALFRISPARSPSAQLRDWIEADRRNARLAVAMTVLIALLALLVGLAGSATWK